MIIYQKELIGYLELKKSYDNSNNKIIKGKLIHESETYNKDGILMIKDYNDVMNGNSCIVTRNEDIATSSVKISNKDETKNIEIYNDGEYILPKTTFSCSDDFYYRLKQNLNIAKGSGCYSDYVIPENQTANDRNAKVNEIIDESNNSKLQQMYNEYKQKGKEDKKDDEMQVE